MTNVCSNTPDQQSKVETFNFGTWQAVAKIWHILTFEIEQKQGKSLQIIEIEKENNFTIEK